MCLRHDMKYGCGHLITKEYSCEGLLDKEESRCQHQFDREQPSVPVYKTVDYPIKGPCPDCRRKGSEKMQDEE